MCFPDEWLWVGGIVFTDEAIDGGLEIDEGMEDTVLEPAPREFGKEALDGIEPRTRGWREVESPAWMTVEPGADLVLLVRRVIVEDHVDGLVRRLSLLLTPSGAETLVFWVSQPLAWLVAPKDVPLMTRRGDLKLSHGATAKAERTP